MNIDQFQTIQNLSLNPTINVKALSDKKERTLLYGYMLSRDTFHVYIRNGILHKVIYDGESHEAKLYESGEAISLDGIVPSKRLYPECCDFEFCELLVKAGVDLRFTVWTERLESKTFYGRVVQSGTKLSAWSSKK